MSTASLVRYWPPRLVVVEFVIGNAFAARVKILRLDAEQRAGQEIVDIARRNGPRLAAVAIRAAHRRQIAVIGSPGKAGVDDNV